MKFCPSLSQALLSTGLVAIAACSSGSGGDSSNASPAPQGSSPQSAADADKGPLVLTRLTDPARTEVHDADGAWLATFTDGARTVHMVGPSRTFADPLTTAKVTTTSWVRLMPQPFSGAVDEAWLEAALGDSSPDILAKATEYLDTAKPMVVDAVQIAGNADYGSDTGADFNDYLGVTWTYPEGTLPGGPEDPPEKAELRHLDCSGFIRMLFGYRGSVPLGWDPDPAQSWLPRRSHEIAYYGPGVLLIPDQGKQITAFDRLQPGDLVFFDAHAGDGARLDHTGFYLGVDDAGHHRYFSSRTSLRGPTFGDGDSPSILDGNALYATTFHAARRL